MTAHGEKIPLALGDVLDFLQQDVKRGQIEVALQQGGLQAAVEVGLIQQVPDWVNYVGTVRIDDQIGRLVIVSSDMDAAHPLCG